MVTCEIEHWNYFSDIEHVEKYWWAAISLWNNLEILSYFTYNCGVILDSTLNHSRWFLRPDPPPWVGSMHHAAKRCQQVIHMSVICCRRCRQLSAVSLAMAVFCRWLVRRRGVGSCVRVCVCWDARGSGACGFLVVWWAKLLVGWRYGHRRYIIDRRVIGGDAGKSGLYVGKASKLLDDSGWRCVDWPEWCMGCSFVGWRDWLVAMVGSARHLLAL